MVARSRPAETAAATVPLRSALEARTPDRDDSGADGADEDLLLIRIVAESARNYSDATSVLVLDTSGEVLASPEPAQLGRVLELPGDVLTTGRSWVGELESDGRRLVLAQAPPEHQRQGDEPDLPDVGARVDTPRAGVPGRGGDAQLASLGDLLTQAGGSLTGVDMSGGGASGGASEQMLDQSGGSGGM